MIVPTYPGRVVPRINFYGRKFGMGFLRGEILVQGFLEALGIFGGFDF